jgi:D-xylono/L-arabinono-1,4-lactonase
MQPMFRDGEPMDLATSSNSGVELAAHARCRLGEQPVWDPVEQALLWTDIDSGLLYRYHVRTAVWDSFYQGPAVGGFTRQEDGTLLLFRLRDVCHLRRDGVCAHVADAPAGILRFNDAIADPEGRVFVGGKSAPGSLDAGLFRLDLDGRIEKVVSGTSIANGMAFSLDLSVFYWTDSTARTIFAFDYDRRSGQLSGRRPFIEIEPDEGVPDGLTVDSAGCLWSARWGGGAVHRYSPSGEWLSKLQLPVTDVSAAAFGGADLSTLFVTTAGGEDGSASIAGGLFSARMEVRGRFELPSRVRL